MGQKFSNAARVELATTINSSDTQLDIVEGGALFPVANTGATTIGDSLDWFKLVLQDLDHYEIIYVRTHAAGSNTFSNVLRGQEGTTAREFANGSVIGLRPTAGDAQSTVDGLASKAPLASPTFTGTVSGITKTMVGLSNVDNTSDASKPVSTAQATAIATKQATLVSGSNIKTINGGSILGSGDITITQLADAPSDGKTYGRKDEAWVEASSLNDELLAVMYAVSLAN